MTTARPHSGGDCGRLVAFPMPFDEGGAAWAGPPIQNGPRFSQPGSWFGPAGSRPVSNCRRRVCGRSRSVALPTPPGQRFVQHGFEPDLVVLGPDTAACVVIHSLDLFAVLGGGLDSPGTATIIPSWSKPGAAPGSRQVVSLPSHPLFAATAVAQGPFESPGTERGLC